MWAWDFPISAFRSITGRRSISRAKELRILHRRATPSSGPRDSRKGSIRESLGLALPISGGLHAARVHSVDDESAGEAQQTEESPATPLYFDLALISPAPA